MKNGHIVNKRSNSYLGCEAPRGFFLRWQAYCEMRGIDKRVLILAALEADLVKWENKLDVRSGQAYDALLEIKARQNGLSVNDLKKEIEVSDKKGVGRNSVRKNPQWPKIAK